MLRALVVDDDPLIRRMLRQVLEQSRFAVEEAAHGRAAMEKLRQDPYEILLTDIMMPEMDGLELISIVRRQFPEVRIVAISAGGRLGDPDDLATARMLGAVAVLNKPFRVAALRAVLAVALDDGGPEESNGNCVAC